MLIIGHYAISHMGFVRIFSIEQICKSRANEILYFSANDDDDYALSRHCFENRVDYAILISNVSELMIYANLGAKFAILPLAQLLSDAGKNQGTPLFQILAERYLLDLKILAQIDSEHELESVARLGVDGAIFSHILE